MSFCRVLTLTRYENHVGTLNQRGLDPLSCAGRWGKPCLFERLP